MTWRQWQSARQLLMEEHLGVYIRQSQHREDAEFKHTASKLGRR